MCGLVDVQLTHCCNNSCRVRNALAKTPSSAFQDSQALKNSLRETLQEAERFYVEATAKTAPCENIFQMAFKSMFMVQKESSSIEKSCRASKNVCEKIKNLLSDATNETLEKMHQQAQLDRAMALQKNGMDSKAAKMIGNAGTHAVEPLNLFASKAKDHLKSTKISKRLRKLSVAVSSASSDMIDTKVLLDLITTRLKKGLLEDGDLGHLKRMLGLEKTRALSQTCNQLDASQLQSLSDHFQFLETIGDTSKLFDALGEVLNAMVQIDKKIQEKSRKMKRGKGGAPKDKGGKMSFTETLGDHLSFSTGAQPFDGGDLDIWFEFAQSEAGRKNSNTDDKSGLTLENFDRLLGVFSTDERIVAIRRACKKSVPLTDLERAAVANENAFGNDAEELDEKFWQTWITKEDFIYGFFDPLSEMPLAALMTSLLKKAKILKELFDTGSLEKDVASSAKVLRRLCKEFASRLMPISLFLLTETMMNAEGEANDDQNVEDTALKGYLEKIDSICIALKDRNPNDDGDEDFDEQIQKGIGSAFSSMGTVGKAISAISRLNLKDMKEDSDEILQSIDRGINSFLLTLLSDSHRGTLSNSTLLANTNNQVGELLQMQSKRFQVGRVLSDNAESFWVQHFGSDLFEVPWERFLMTMEAVFGKIKASNASDARAKVANRHGIVTCIHLKFVLQDERTNTLEKLFKIGCNPKRDLREISHSPVSSKPAPAPAKTSVVSLFRTSAKQSKKLSTPLPLAL